MGNSATLNTGTTSGTVATGDHTHSITTISGLQTALDGKASTSHTHPISAVTNLASTLAVKAELGHTHTMSEITDLSFPTASVYYGDTAPSDSSYNLWIQTSTARIFNKIDGFWVEAAAGFGPLVIENTGGGTSGGTGTGAVDSVNGLTGAVTLTPSIIGAANATHGHTISNITNLQTTLNSKVNNSGGVSNIIKVSSMPSVVDPNTLYIVVQ